MSGEDRTQKEDFVYVKFIESVQKALSCLRSVEPAKYEEFSQMEKDNFCLNEINEVKQYVEGDKLRMHNIIPHRIQFLEALREKKQEEFKI